MTKKLLLTAAALGAMAFAGAANAGTVTDAKLSNVPVASTTGGVTTLAPYAIATETKLAAAGTSALDTATSYLTTTISSPVAVTEGNSVSFVISYTLTGPGEFGTIAVADLVATKTGAATVAAPTGVATVSSDKKTATFIVTFNITGSAGDAANITGFTFSKLDIKATAEQDISIASEVKLNSAGVQTSIDSVAATKIVTFKAALKASSAAAYGVVADLPDFKKFESKAAVAPSVANATVSAATSNPIAIGVNQDVRKDLTGGSALAVTDILSGATATVTGPQVKALGATLAGVSPAAATLTNTSGVYTLTAANLAATSTAGSLVLSTPTPAVAIDAGSYKVEIKPTFATDFEGSADQTLTLLNVTLDGTNFYAPWFALNNGTANSTLRLANNGTSATGPVTIALKANNGSAAPTGTYTIAAGIPAGQFVSVTGETLRTAFGTDAANGDLQVTIQSDVANVSAKVRTTQASGQIFENSLGANPPAN